MKILGKRSDSTAAVAARLRPGSPRWWQVVLLGAGVVFASGLTHAAPPSHAQGKGPPAHAQGGASKDRAEHRDNHDSTAWYAERRDRRQSSTDVLVDLMLSGITRDDARRWAAMTGSVDVASLPPGIQRNLARGKPLPPGIAKKAVPEGMLARLPRYEGYQWVRAGTDLLLVVTATQVIADVLNDVFR